ncbi:DUF3429 domain-containing protein [Photobacterium sp. 1_MG-2023]|uniref:DUF3429 domain-containing protein n=1 Tax=Photobacterium sp. 1_MG-2023 TaxID=3062646 RepID=UPI0026E4230A|nr:DUF3429 domain-containing protein [Photobacterium sp. 1_MG-2023]MDO6708552.1 DUF3429 domain-containing protein [Photobacterium sp. 1_MG-2023]
MQNQNTIMKQLGYLGLLPFVVTLLLAIADIRLFQLSGHQMFIAYSAVILSFLSGILWGNAIDHSSHRLSKNALILSNLFVLLAWGAILQGNKHALIATGLLALGYLAVWFAEKLIRQTEGETAPADYQPLRGRLTLGAVVLHLLLMLF